MKQFLKILKFELKSYFTNKIFVGVTVFLVVALTIVMFFPRMISAFENGEEETPSTKDLPVMLVVTDEIDAEFPITQSLQMAFEGSYLVKNGAVNEYKEQILSGKAECAFVFHSPVSYTYYVNNLSMYDTNTVLVDEVLKEVYRMSAMVGGGFTPEQATEILGMQIESKVESLGKDQTENFFYTYIMIFALYMVILMYGQMVATNVATEKSSRAMELLVTSAKPTSMMFGKVIASCLAGLIQLVAVFGSALLSYKLNESFWTDVPFVASMFDMPIDLFIYMLVFFVLGFFIYAFLYGAIGSTASKLEDINTSVMPITLLFIVGFMVVMFSMIDGNVDSTLMKVCSYIPFTSPMAMFTRIAMSTVSLWEILLSMGVLVASVVGVGVLSAKIYRVGVLLYGTPPKLGAIIKAIRKA